MLEGDQRSDFSRRVFIAEFGQGLPIGDRETLGALLERMRRRTRRRRLNAPKPTRTRRGSKAECARAVEIGIIGAPCLVTADGEVFWGNDRLEQGLDWAVERGRRSMTRLVFCRALARGRLTK